MIKKIEVNKFNIQIEDSNVSNYLNTVSNGDVNNLKKIFLINNLNYDNYKNNIEIELRWQKLIVSKFRSKITIDDQEIQNLIDRASNEKRSLNDYKLSKIEIIFNDKNDLKKKIATIKNEINKFGFEDTALKLKVSNSQISKGEIDWINEKALSKTILGAIKNLGKNEISKPIVISNSVLFLKVTDIKKSNLNVLNLEELKKNILDQRTNELLSSYSKSHLSKLRNISLINYR
jgi:parvulin-like peptidyl-prolyl isomerase